MTIKGWLAISAFSAFCCGTTDQEVAPDPGLEAALPAFDINPSADLANDFFGCVVPPSESPNFPTPFACASPLIPSRCNPSTDFAVVHPAHDRGDIIVLTLHGGHIELYTSEVGDLLAQKFNWDRYDFKGHGTPSCLRGRTNFEVLHITATHFNDPDAVNPVRTHRQAVAIDSARNLVGSRRGTICVGGLNGASRDEFIRSIRSNPLADCLPFSLTLVDAIKDTAFPCSDSAGASLFNLVNLGENGGLQLTMGTELLAALAAKNPEPSVSNLQQLFSAAVKAAVGVQ